MCQRSRRCRNSTEAERILVKEDGVVALIYQASGFAFKPKVKQFEVLAFGRSNNLRPVYIDE